MWRSIRPYIFHTIYILFIFLVVPITLIICDVVEVKGGKYFNITILVFIFILYLYFVTTYVLRSVRAIIDLATKRFVTKKMTYVDSYFDNSRIILHRNKTKKHGKQLLETRECCYMRVWLADHEGKYMFLTTFPHLMQKGERYTIRYGKLSKIIVSILSDQGIEMIQSGSARHSL